jgi:hypothetical protein
MSGESVTENSDALKEEVRRRLERMSPNNRLEELMRLQDALSQSPRSEGDTILSNWLRYDDRRHGHLPARRGTMDD